MSRPTARITQNRENRRRLSSTISGMVVRQTMVMKQAASKSATFDNVIISRLPSFSIFKFSYTELEASAQATLSSPTTSVLPTSFHPCTALSFGRIFETSLITLGLAQRTLLDDQAALLNQRQSFAPEVLS